MNFDKLVHGLKEKSGTGLEKLKSGIGLDKLEKPLPPDELGEHIIVTYQRLRLGMGFIALFFPVAIVGFGFLFNVNFETSYSAYYFGLPAGDLEARIFPGIFPTRVLFCGLLFALGVFLILYRGFNTPENILLMIAGVAAIFVAVFPMWYDKMYPVAIESAPVLPLAPDCKCPAAASSFRYEDMFRLFSKIHYYSACVLFGCMALVAWFCSKTTLKNKTLSAGLDKKPPTWADLNPKCSSFVIAWLPVLAIPFLWLRDKLPTQRDTFRRNYNWIGLAMALFPVAVWAVASWTQQNKYLVLIVEAIGVWTFAAFWLLKSHELMLSRPEEKAIKGNPLVPLFLLPSDDARVGPDYTVRWREPDGRELSVGRIFRASAGVPEATPWFWSVDFDQRPGRAEPHEGHAATEEDARASWKRCWESADVPIRWPPFDVATGPNSRPQSVQPTSQFEAGRRDP